MFSMSEVLLTSTDGEPTVVDFTSSCKAEMWVVDDLGRTVFDSRTGKTCSEIDLELTLSDEPEHLTLPQWYFYLETAAVRSLARTPSSLKYLEYGLAASQHIEYTSMEANPCAEASSADLEASLSWSDETTMNVAAMMSSEANDYLPMAQPCAFEVEFLNLDNELVHQFQTLCDAYDGRKILLPSSEEPLQFDSLAISMVQGGSLVPDGEYTLQLTVLATSTATVSMPFSWPQDFGEVVEEEVVETIAPERFELLGTWTAQTTPQGTCYVMDNGEETHLLANARTLPTWTPSSRCPRPSSSFRQNHHGLCRPRRSFG